MLRRPRRSTQPLGIMRHDLSSPEWQLLQTTADNLVHRANEGGPPRNSTVRRHGVFA